MWSDFLEDTSAGVGRDWNRHEHAGFSVSTTASHTILIKDITFVAEEVEAAAVHANEEIDALVFEATDAEESVFAADIAGSFLGGHGDAREGNQC